MFRGVDAFYRWRSFWAGVVVLVFLVWGWWDSGGHVSRVGWERGSVLRQVEVAGGQVLVTVARDLSGSAGVVSVRAWQWGREVVMDGATGVRRERCFDYQAGWDRNFEVVRIPAFGLEREVRSWRVGMWAVVVSYGVVWVGVMLVWRWWRRRGSGEGMTG